ncbi:hypothetical protein B0T14DRAFT_572049 [Immersiella caudata]|uniref:NACHT domain-containing protein n=1 Tax=Immersiella caudata TaxID=314043 RepID=A0AA39TZ11_9PEZI|nr:hypothetical protein B0T14DRAFT_572049 [Immersiella caudata]
MDPITAVGLASSIITFVEFGVKLVGGAREIYFSTTGKTAQNATAELVVNELKLWSTRLVPPVRVRAPTDEETSVYNLAEECRAICDEMLTLLDKSRSRRSDSKTSAAVAVFKDVWHKNDREKCKARLQDCQKQLNVQVATLDRSAIKASLQDLAESATKSDKRLAALEKAADDLKTLASSFSIDSALAEQLFQLQKLPDDAVREIAAQRLLSTLRFPDMHGRFDQVLGAHESTFRWILEQEPSVGGTDSLSGSSFVDWLASNDPEVFHIAGKLGSGKSTLMKFLFESDRLKERLSPWADGKHLVLVNFFFWRAGSELQKSLDGLQRSLLYDLLKQRPDLIPSVLPLQWGKITSLHLQADPDLRIFRTDVQKAFKELSRDHRLYDKHSFCIFIDGLDEYAESREYHYEDMVALLRQWAAASPANLKICVSSREIPPFENAFSPRRRLRLQDLTRDDIEGFIHARIQSFWVPNQAEEDDAEQKLVSKVADKASGVFLWVALVLETLQDGCRNGDRLKGLLEKIDDMPPEIESLYEHLLGSIRTKADRRAVYRTFDMVVQITESGGTGISLLQYSFLDEFEDNPLFAINAPINEADTTARKSEELYRLERARNRLRGQCKCLLEVDKRNEYIAFVHRSAYDFVREDIKKLSEAERGRLDTVEAISQTYLAELKFLNRLQPSAGSDIRVILVLRKSDDICRDAPPFRFLESLRKATLEVQNATLQSEISRPITYIANDKDKESDEGEKPDEEGSEEADESADEEDTSVFEGFSSDEESNGQGVDAIEDCHELGDTAEMEDSSENEDASFEEDANKRTASSEEHASREENSRSEKGEFEEEGNSSDEDATSEGWNNGMNMISSFYIAASVGLLDYVSWVLDKDFTVSNDTMRFQKTLSVILKTSVQITTHDNIEAFRMVLRYLKQGRLLDDRTTSYTVGDTTVWEEFILFASRMHGMSKVQAAILGEMFEIMLEAGLNSDYKVRRDDRNYLFIIEKTLKRYIRRNLNQENGGATGSTSDGGCDGDGEFGSDGVRGPEVGDLKSLTGSVPAMEPNPSPTETNSRADTHAVDLMPENMVEQSEPVLPQSQPRMPTATSGRWDISLQDVTRWYPLITFGLGIAITVAFTRYNRSR